MTPRAVTTMAEALLATFHCDSTLFGLAVESVQEVLTGQDLQPVPRAPHGVVGMINLRGRVLAVTDVRTRMGMRPAAQGDDGAYYVVHGSAGLDVLRVDRIAEVVPVLLQDMIPVPDTTPPAIADLLSHAYQLDEQLLLVIDLSRLLDSAGQGLVMRT